ncbi:hypothetical protein CFP65_0413 [Kitasatospora sp. MMS16-BH015]|uniref:DUF421 domain-containing protein n=1 Tax=Kitasatospora sp. MMS16-BH015 TaxID=2018025 RepID=UPI000CA3D466|nr:YetF domain-containing protein [Kitasatospora sp. MMS16-BH015]AUG75379.1 hypothetical protein CFP65_0413 [Kitasatospora sp. MMS16-BH015]
MWHDLSSVQIPIAEKILRTVAVYVLIVVLFRLSGKRGLANLNTFDFVVIFLLSNVVQNAVIGNDNSLLGGVIGAVTLVTVNALLNRWLARDRRAARIVEGRPTTVIEDGRLIPAALSHLALRPSEVEHAVRLQNGDAVEDVALGRLDPDGQLIVILKHERQSATRADIARLEDRLAAIQLLLAAGPPRT